MYPVAGQVPSTPLRGLSTAASVAVWVAAVGPMSMAASTPTFGWYAASAQAQLGMGLLGGGLLLSGIGQAVAGILVMMWLVRARANADALYPAPHRLGAGWAVGSWFVPFANLFLPVLVVVDVVKASNPAGRSIPQVAMWWAGWIGGGIGMPLGIAVTVTSDPRSGPAALALFVLVSAVCYTVAAIGFTGVAKNVARWQDERIAQAGRVRMPVG